MADRKLDIVLASKDMTAKGFAAVQGRLAALGRSVFSLQGQLLALAGVGGFGALVKSSFTTIDQLAKTSDKLGVTTEALAGLRHAAELTGVASNTLDMALQRMTRRVAEAAGGTGEAKAAIAELGLDARKLAQLSPDKQFAAIAERMAQVSTQGERVRLAFKLFDSEGVAVVNTLRLGSDGLRKTAEEAKALGLAISRVDAKRIEDANDAMVRIRGAASGIGNTLAISLADPIADIATNTTEWVKANDELIKQNVSDAIDKVGRSLQTIVGLYNSLPEGVVGAAGYGLLGRVLFGGWGPAKLLAVMSIINSQMGKLGMGIGDLAGQYRELNDYMGKMGEVFSGKRDWNTGKTAADLDAALADLDAGRDSSGYIYKGPAPAGSDGAAADAVLRSMGLGQDTKDKIDKELAGYIDAYKNFLDEQKRLKSEHLIAIAQGQGLYKFDPELARFEGGLGQEQYAADLIAQVESSTNAMTTMADSASWSMQSAFSSFFDVTSEGFLSLESLAIGVGQSITRALADALSKQVVSSAFSFMGLASAHGNVFSGGHYVPFAKGGIVGGPTVFPFASGIGLMGEAGPEAIMPLTRTPGGDLGVKSEGGGGAVINHITIQAADAKSFDDMVRRNPGALIKQINKAIAYNGSTRAVIRGTT